jgi:hypothetical protein
MAEPGLPTFSIGRVLGQGLGIYARNFISFSLLALLIGLIDVLATIFYFIPNQAGARGEFRVVGFDAVALILVTLLTYSLTQATIIYGTFQDLRGDKAQIVSCVAHGLTSMFPVIIGSIILSIAVGLASLLVLIPGLILMTMWWVYIPAIVVERKSISAGFGRSVELTRGRGWAIFGIIIIILILSVAVTFVTDIISMSVVTISASTDISFTALILDYIGSSLTAAFGAVVVAVGYYHLRTEKEGIDVNQIASVFD